MAVGNTHNAEIRITQEKTAVATGAGDGIREARTGGNRTADGDGVGVQRTEFLCNCPANDVEQLRDDIAGVQGSLSLVERIDEPELAVAVDGYIQAAPDVDLKTGNVVVFPEDQGLIAHVEREHRGITVDEFLQTVQIADIGKRTVDQTDEGLMENMIQRRALIHGVQDEHGCVYFFIIRHHGHSIKLLSQSVFPDCFDNDCLND